MKRIVALLLCIFLLFLVACEDEESRQEKKLALILSPTQELYVELEMGTRSAENFVSVISTDETFLWDVICISSNEKIATVRHERTEKDIYWFYTIEALAEGEVYIYFESEDGSVQSEMIRVCVVERESPPETQPETADTSAPGDGDTIAPETDDVDGLIVYVTKSGTRYHYKKGCAGKNAIEMSLEEASKTRSPCKTCVPDEKETVTTAPETTAPIPSETTAPLEPAPVDPSVVYITPSGTKYHYKQSCAGKNAIETTLEEATTAGKTACKTCVK